MAKERGCLWTDAEVTAIVAIWGEEEIERQLDGATKNLKVYEKKLELDCLRCKSAVIERQVSIKRR